MINLTEKIGLIEKKVEELEKKSFSKIEDIILNSTYRVLSFAGSAGTPAAPNTLTACFDNSLILNKSILIKSIKVDAYARDPMVDIAFSDGTTETITANMRINRIFDLFTDSLNIDMILNESSTAIFPNDNSGDVYFPIDLFVDNIYKLIKNVNTLTFRAGSFLALNFVGGTTQPNLIITMECYIF
jgi:hypothetical protein